MRIVFFGSDDFAARHLEALHLAHLPIVASVTQPDRPKGRGLLLDISPIKLLAQSYQIPCLQPLHLKDDNIVNQLQALNADLFVVVAYGQILPQRILDLPKIMAINVHGSLLPKYRGAAPIHWAIINGESTTGVSVQKMAFKLDSGDVISQARISILPTMTTAQLREAMSHLGAKLLVDTISQIEKGTFTLLPQDESEVSYAAKLTKDMGLIDWQQPAKQIDRLIRGLYPWPGAYTFWQGKMLKIQGAVSCEGQGLAGEIIGISKQGLLIGCQQGLLRCEVVQPEGKKAMPAYDFALGARLIVGSQFDLKPQ